MRISSLCFFDLRELKCKDSWVLVIITVKETCSGGYHTMLHSTASRDIGVELAHHCAK